MGIPVVGTEVSTRLTYEELRQLPDDGKRYELIHGEVHVAPSPNTKHQLSLLHLTSSLDRCLSQNRIGVIFFAPLDVLLAADTVVQPDLIFISNARTGIILDNYIQGAPDLVVEILSPSTAAHDRATKLALYAEAGAPWVWFLDQQAKTVEVLKLEGRKYLVDTILAGHQVLASGLFPGWQLPLDELFDFRPRS
jgi:Uma2 family endonuclease